MSTARMTRTATAVTVALSAPLASVAAAIALGGQAIAPTFAALLAAAFIVERPR